MATNYGYNTSSMLDTPLAAKSTVAKYLNANGVSFTGANTVRILNYDVSGTSLTTYDETDFTDRTPTGVELGKQELTISYNKAQFLRIQKTQMQDIPVGSFAAKIAKSWADTAFVPAYDAYALGVVYAARPAGNKVTWDTTTDDLKTKFYNTISKISAKGGSIGNMIAWVPYSFGDSIRGLVTTFDGSDLGYTAGRNGAMGTLKGVTVVETDGSYFSSALVDAVVADKRALVSVSKMDPSDFTLIKEVPKFRGSELQISARGDVFVLSKKVNLIASLEHTNS